MPHQCAHWFAMTPPPLSLRGAKRRGNPHLLRQHKTMRKYLRQIRRSCEFALSAAYCSVLLQGERIAAPVCALVRNDMLKTDACQRLQGRGAQGARKHAGCQRLQGVVRNDTSSPVIARSEATWQSVFLRQHKTMRKYLRRIRRSCEFALSAAYCSVLLQGERIATPVCALVRNDMQKTDGLQRLQGVVRNDMLKTDACQRLQGRGAQGARKHAGCQRLQGRFPAVHRQCPGIVRTGGKFLHVIVMKIR